MPNLWPAWSDVHTAQLSVNLPQCIFCRSMFPCDQFSAGQTQEIGKLSNVVSVEWAGCNTVVYTQPDAISRPARVHSSKLLSLSVFW